MKAPNATADVGMVHVATADVRDGACCLGRAGWALLPQTSGKTGVQLPIGDWFASIPLWGAPLVLRLELPHQWDRTVHCNLDNS